jgi:hypothetical protein
MFGPFDLLCVVPLAIRLAAPAPGARGSVRGAAV